MTGLGSFFSTTLINTAIIAILLVLLGGFF